MLIGDGPSELFSYSYPAENHFPNHFKIGSSAQSTFTMNVKLPPGRMGASCQNWIFYKLSSGQAATAHSGRTPRLRSEEPKIPTCPRSVLNPEKMELAKLNLIRIL